MVVSVIIPVYNIEKYINRCVESIINQQYTDYELILVDDGSTDKSGIICDEISKNNQRIRVIHKENGGVSSARNEGLRVAQGEYIVFVDGDDFVTNSMLERLVDSITMAHADISICAYNSVSKSGVRKNVLADMILDKNKKDVDSFIYLYEHYFINALWNKIYKRELITVYFNTNYSMGEDLIFNLNYLKNCSRIATISDSLYNYCLRGASATGAFQENRISVIIQLHNFVCDFIKDYYDYNCFDKIYRVNLNKIDAAFYMLMSSLENKGKKINIIKEWIADSELKEFIQKSSVQNIKPYYYMYIEDDKKVYRYYSFKTTPSSIKKRVRLLFQNNE